MEKLVNLVLEAKNGNQKSFEEIIDMYEKKAKMYAYIKVKDYPLAEEITQDTFLKAFEDIKTLIEPKLFYPWFKRILSKHCDRMTRKKRLNSPSKMNFTIYHQLPENLLIY